MGFQYCCHIAQWSIPEVWFHDGDVILDERHHQCIGAEAANSFTAELSAIMWALTWVAQLKGSPPVTLHVDCLSAAFFAGGKWSKMKTAGCTSW